MVEAQRNDDFEEQFPEIGVLLDRLRNRVGRRDARPFELRNVEGRLLRFTRRSREDLMSVLATGKPGDEFDAYLKVKRLRSRCRFS